MGLSGDRCRPTAHASTAAAILAATIVAKHAHELGPRRVRRLSRLVSARQHPSRPQCSERLYDLSSLLWVELASISVQRVLDRASFVVVGDFDYVDSERDAEFVGDAFTVMTVEHVAVLVVGAARLEVQPCRPNDCAAVTQR